jgi:DNA excision repair protein ERCC-2
MKPELHIGVRELVEFVLRCGDLKHEFAGSSRAVDAMRLHQRIQCSRPDGYLPEAAVGREVDTPELTLTIGGRIDGVIAGIVPVIEEIKTTRRDPAEAIAEENALHWGQAKAYAFIYAAAHGLDEIGVQLTYARFDTGRVREVRRTFAIGELREFFDDLVGRYLEWARCLIAWRRERDGSIRRLEFPYPAFRPGQREMLAAVERTLHAGGRSFIQAATGIGKTMAVLLPAVQSLAAQAVEKVFYLTARTTGRLAAEKALDELRARGLKLKSLSLTAKEKICACPGCACTPEECTVARGHFDRLPGARRAAFELDAWTREAVSEAARRFAVCPFELALDLSSWADLIVCDYNYAFDPSAYLRRFFDDEPGDYAFLVDEAHNLVDRAREMFSAELHRQSLLELRRTVKAALPAVYRALGRVDRWMLAAHTRCAEAGAPVADREAPEDLYPLLQEFLTTAESWLERNTPAPFRAALLERYFEAGAFLRVSERFDRSYAACYEAAGKELRARLFCIDPSQQLADALARGRATVFFSATLAPFDYFKTLLAGDSAETLVLPSPFPPENLAVFIADRVSTYYRHRDRTRAEIARLALAFVRPQGGNYLLFFPSYAYLRMVFDEFRMHAPEIEVIVQEAGMGEREREAFLARFDADNPHTLVGFAVMGGVFGEGIDLVGNRLSGAGIVGVGLPGVCLERELIRTYFDERIEQGFEYAYMYPGINRVLQAAGRVIRTDEDRGALLLIDRRYGGDGYRRLLPGDWRPASVRDGPGLSAGLESFWRPGRRRAPV